MNKINLEKIKKIHIIGIEGAGTSALARIFKLSGKDVSGSDEGDHFFHRMLKDLNIKIFHKFDGKNIDKNVDLIIYGTSFKPEKNQELAAALESGKPVITYAEGLAMVFNQKFGIAVCGTHGKTTTSAWLSYVLEKCGQDPSAVIGSRLINWQTNSRVGKGKYFVIEADEYQNKLRFYDPAAAILTSADWDHPDFFPTPDEYKKVFEDFVAKIPKHGFLVAWGDSRDVLDVIKTAKCEVITYGFLEENIVRITDQESGIMEGGKYYQKFNLAYKNQDRGQFEIQLLGKHNILNAVAVVAACMKLNIPVEDLETSLKEFQGTARRFEYIGMRNGAILIDDYGHHPEEIKATLSATRDRYPEKNIIAVFHPHSFTRTEALLQEFSQSFDDADEVIVLDIYGSAREKEGNVSSKDLVALINKYSHGKADHIPTIGEAVENLSGRVDEDDIVLAIGAGNVWEVADKLKN
jgi:UDP-N-acetylmuramate--alanine ligase